MAKYEQYKKYRSKDAELKSKRILEGLNLPGLIIRSVVKLDVWKRCSLVYQNAGIKITAKDVPREQEDEYDLQMVYVDGNRLNWILIEVKNKNLYPWQSTTFTQQVNLKLLEKAWVQLAKSFTFISELFSDIPFGKVHAFTAVPNMSRQVLEQRLNPKCMEMILCLEDFTNPLELRRRLGIETDKGKNLLCTVASRMIGPGSDLFVPIRTPPARDPRRKNT